MTLTNTRPGSTSEVTAAGLTRTARTTGLLYLGLAVTGVLGYQLVRGQLYVADDPQATLSNLVERTALARLGIVLELGIVLTQALAAVWFYRLFRRVDSFAAGLIAVFGTVNAVTILGSAAMLATALDVAGDTSLAVSGGAAATVQLLYVVSGHLWGVGGLFFGLWLIPMGWLVVRSRWLPWTLGGVLIAGGVGYVIGTFVDFAFANAGLVAGLLTVPATIGELWIVGYLIVFGVRDHARTGASAVR
ncbi:DUF4386 domain-containing protein [Nocardioides cynanchi]|uniref:DUF4386 domain-containing protein n=1 Tax=Nocardioides cynanchi TaxID=2558918 RepID=UPI0012468EC4|nr:DUF4386 domain-containing protein [Nocardioides cynanchi]